MVDVDLCSEGKWLPDLPNFGSFICGFFSSFLSKMLIAAVFFGFFISWLWAAHITHHQNMTAISCPAPLPTHFFQYRHCFGVIATSATSSEVEQHDPSIPPLYLLYRMVRHNKGTTGCVKGATESWDRGFLGDWEDCLVIKPGGSFS